MRISNNANTHANIIDISGLNNHREVALQAAPPAGLTPGCIIEVQTLAPPIAATRSFAVLNTSAAAGGSLTAVYHAGDQVEALWPGRGSKVNVRIATGATVAENQWLTVATDGSGFVEAGTEANAIGIARSDTPSGNSDAPTFIILEVL